MTARVTSGPEGRRVALITGAGRGLGHTLALFAGGLGFDLVLNSRHRPQLSATADSARKLGASVQEVVGDVSTSSAQRELHRAVAPRGRLDLLVNNASELGGPGLGPLARYPVEEIRRVLEVNLLGPVALVQRLLPELRAARGSIVNITSDASVMGYAGWGAYAASKAALDSVTRTLANELRDDGVSVVSVDPGDMRTAMHQAAYPGLDISDRPPPEVTLPFWAWLLGRRSLSVSGQRFQAQSRSWEIPA